MARSASDAHALTSCQSSLAAAQRRRQGWARLLGRLAILLALGTVLTMGGWWLDTAGAAQGVEPPDAPLAVGRQVFRALLAGDADGVFALLPSAEQDAPAHEAIARAVAGLAPCQGQDPPLISHAVTPTHVVVAAVFDPPCGVGAYADARACEVSVELLDGGWRPTLRERPLLRCVP